MMGPNLGFGRDTGFEGAVEVSSCSTLALFYSKISEKTKVLIG